jgi:hypothetical protein
MEVLLWCLSLLQLFLWKSSNYVLFWILLVESQYSFYSKLSFKLLTQDPSLNLIFWPWLWKNTFRSILDFLYSYFVCKFHTQKFCKTWLKLGHKFPLISRIAFWHIYVLKNIHYVKLNSNILHLTITVSCLNYQTTHSLLYYPYLHIDKNDRLLCNKVHHPEVICGIHDYIIHRKTDYLWLWVE